MPGAAPGSDESAARASEARAARLAWIAPSILIAVALAQFVLVRRADFSPWKGGGFGMFSTTDHGPSRSVRVLAVDDAGTHVLRLPDEARRLVSQVEHGPVRPLVTRLAALAARDAREEGDRVTRVRVQVWRTTYGKRWLEPTESLLREIDVDVPPDDP